MRGMNSDSVDLIYLDPPFNSNRAYEAPIGSEAAGAAFKDSWTLDDVDLAWHGEIADRDPALYDVIAARRFCPQQKHESVRDHDDRSVAGDAAHPETDRFYLSSLRPDRKPLSETGNGRRLWAGQFSERNHMEKDKRSFRRAPVWSCA